MGGAPIHARGQYTPSRLYPRSKYAILLVLYISQMFRFGEGQGVSIITVWDGWLYLWVATTKYVQDLDSESNNEFFNNWVNYE